MDSSKLRLNKNYKCFHFLEVKKMDKEIYNLIRNHGKELMQSEGMQSQKEHMQHGTISVYQHCFAVAYTSLYLAKCLHIAVDQEQMLRGALLHDYFLYDWHVPDESHKWHGYSHAAVALENAARDFELQKIEKDIIEKHMFPLNLTKIPKYRESVLVCIADKICATRETLFCRNNKKQKHREGIRWNME